MAAPLQEHQRQYIVSLLALGNTKPEIIKKFNERYHRKIHPTTIIRLKKQQGIAIGEAHDVLAAKSEIVGANALKQKTYRLLDRKLDRAIDDDTEIDQLRAKLKAGEIDRKEFDYECAKYEVLTVRELTQIADTMNKHGKGEEDDGALSPQDQAMLQMIMQAINSGNAVNLVQVVNPQIHASPIGGNPVPPVDIPSTPAPAAA